MFCVNASTLCTDKYYFIFLNMESEFAKDKSSRTDFSKDILRTHLFFHLDESVIVTYVTQANYKNYFKYTWSFLA